MSNDILEGWGPPPDPATLRGWLRSHRPDPTFQFQAQRTTPLRGYHWLVADGTPRIEMAATDEGRLQVLVDGTPQGEPTDPLAPDLLYTITVTVLGTLEAIHVTLAADGNPVPAGADLFCARCGWVGEAATLTRWIIADPHEGPICPVCAAPADRLPADIRREGEG